MKPTTRTIMMLLLAAAMSASLHQRGAAAQTAPIKKGDELRPIYVTPADVADGKQFADSACAGCHTLADQKAAFLFVPIRRFLDICCPTACFGN